VHSLTLQVEAATLPLSTWCKHSVLFLPRTTGKLSQNIKLLVFIRTSYQIELNISEYKILFVWPHPTCSPEDCRHSC
jgi:hypothetical protein